MTEDYSNSIERAVKGDGFSWEEQFPRSWEIIRENEEGILVSSNLSSRQRQRDEYFHSNQFRNYIKGCIKRGMIRHTCVIIDGSVYSNERDWLPTRFEAMLAMLKQYVYEYFDQNPISQLGLIITKDGIGEILSPLDGNAEEHLNVLKSCRIEPRGEPSLQNALILARSLLNASPSKATKEILILYSGLTSCDPSDISNIVEELKKDFIRVSVIHSSAELKVCQTICKQTQGVFSVALDEAHFKELLKSATVPLPLPKQKTSWKCIKMGFPNRVRHDEGSLCACHAKITLEGYICPVCQSKMCHLPMECVICGLTLVASTHLARSYHHLFPVQEFELVSLNDETLSDRHQESLFSNGCTACTEPLMTNKASLITKCTKCNRLFCEDCDKFIHDVLHSCPGCLNNK